MAVAPCTESSSDPESRGLQGSGWQLRADLAAGLGGAGAGAGHGGRGGSGTGSCKSSPSISTTWACALTSLSLWVAQLCLQLNESERNLGLQPPVTLWATENPMNTPHSDPGLSVLTSFPWAEGGRVGLPFFSALSVFMAQTPHPASGGLPFGF